MQKLRPIVEFFHLQEHLCVFLPLLAAGGELGTLELGFDQSLQGCRQGKGSPRPGCLADQVAVAVTNVLLLRRTDEALVRRATEMEKLRDINLAISSTLDLDTVLARVLVQHVRTLFPGTEATIWEYHNDTRDLSLLHSTIPDPVYRTQHLDMQSPAGQAVFLQKIVSVPTLELLREVTDC